MKSILKFSTITFCLALFLGQTISAQVRIAATPGTADPSAMLDVVSTTKGFLTPRMTAAERMAIPSPATGLMVYQLDAAIGFWYFNGAVWVQAIGPVGPTGATGVAGPIGPVGPAGSANIAGTTNFVVKFTGASTGGNSQIFDNGTSVVVGNGATVLFPTVKLNVESATGTAIISRSAVGRGIDAQAALGTQIAVVGNNTAAAGAGAGFGVVGFTAQSAGVGVQGQNSNAAGNAAVGLNTTAAGAGTGSGALGQTAQSAGFGVRGINTNATGTGVLGQGNNIAGSFLTAGSGGAFTGTITGAYARSTTAGVGEALYTDQFGDITRVNYWSGASQFKIIGVGAVSTIVDGGAGNKVILVAPEAPEALFEDYGQGQLVNGTAHIVIDPMFARNVEISNDHPLRVYVQLEGNCNGVYVTNKTTTSFDVVELAGGHSNTPFQYHIVCNRADEVSSNGRTSHFADHRFEIAPADLPVETVVNTVNAVNPGPSSDINVNPTKAAQEIQQTPTEIKKN